MPKTPDIPNRPNVLLLFSDEHSFRFMGHVPEEEGGEPCLTPAFDRLASQGTVFTDAYCQMPLCTPSRMCMLTGLEVRRCGAWTNEAVLRPELHTLPQTFAQAGYETSLVGKMHLGGSRQFCGFQHRPYGDLTGKTGHQWEPIGDLDRKGMRERTTKAGVTGIPESQIQDRIVAQESVAFLREHQRVRPDKSWFLCAGFSRPHFPLTAPRRHFDMYWPNGVTEPRVGAGGDAYEHPMSVGMRKGFRAADITRDEMMRARAAYFACVSYLDEVVGDMLQQLEGSGLLENTIVVYTTDHGEMAGEHGVWWKNGWYEACTRVPLIISLPGQRRGDVATEQCRTPVGLIDLFPTLCALAGVSIPSGLDGMDLSAAVYGGGVQDHPVFCDALQPRWGPGTEFRMIRWKQYKYVRFRDAPPLFFDLAEDPGEQCNLIGKATGAAREAMAKLENHAAVSIDFDEAERERTERDGALDADYRLERGGCTGNLYVLPSGTVIDADDLLYRPTILTEEPGKTFADWPGGVE